MTYAEDVFNSFPWYDNSHSIWQGNPSFDSDGINSTPDKNHVGDLYDMTQRKTAVKKTLSSGAGTSANVPPSTEANENLMGPNAMEMPNETGEDQAVEDDGGKEARVPLDPTMDEHEDVMYDEGPPLDFWEQEQMDIGNDEQDIDMDSASAQGDQVCFL